MGACGDGGFPLDVSVLVVDVVSVFVVSVLVVSVFDVSVAGGGGGDAGGPSVCGGATVSVAVAGVCRWRRGRAGAGCPGCGIAAVVVEVAGIVVVALDIGGGMVVDVRGGAVVVAVGAGSVPATVFGDCVPSGAGLSGSVKFVVVSTPVSVSGGVVSPGPLMVDVTPFACPSGTT